MPHMNGSIDVRKREALRDVVLLQYLPRFLRIYPLYKVLLRVNPMTTAWAGVFLNFFLYILGSHVFGAIWYFLSIGRVDMCLRESCRSTSTCELYSFYCGNHNSGGGVLLQTPCPIIEPNTTVFDFGIYLDALQSGIPKLSFPEKLTYCFWWGLQNIGSFGQNLKTSAYIWEVCFAVSVSVFGLFFFMLLIGNVQTYLQSDTVKSEKEFRKKIQDTEQWMSRKFLPENLRQRIRQYELHIWQTTQGFDAEILLRKLPKDLKRDIKRHLGLALLMQVPMFEKMDDQFLDALCDRLKPVLYTEDNLIIQEGHPVEEMLFIMSGELLSVSTHGGNTSVFDSDYLKAGDFIGEELLFWALLPTSSSYPISTRTVHALKEVEAFALIGEDLKLVISQFRLQRKQLRHILRFYSQRWRTWAAYYIQLAWRQYLKRKLDKCRLEEESKLQYQIIKNVASSTSLGATIYASRFAANILHNLRRRTARKAMLRHVLGQIQKPDEPELLC
ncbi:Cyclic nucleotide-gated ion channel [Thalictrum thalictroides]|uniref:Cyclic nucleotide-gated ion channel n=1 Tax=Thalictrum thalictroides TaxID=46969 RepID=A0A7J6VWT1_THATH|nr:Cyclic nucleotide-gated ion channel [Thalictrum thalictroides]